MKKIFFFLKEENFTHNMNLCNHELNKTSTNTIMNYLFLYFKNLHALKIIYVSKEDTNQFFDKKMFGFATNEDTNQF